jgi:hypothetical protein
MEGDARDQLQPQPWTVGEVGADRVRREWSGSARSRAGGVLLLSLF